MFYCRAKYLEWDIFQRFSIEGTWFIRGKGSAQRGGIQVFYRLCLSCAEYLSGITADAECSSGITADAKHLSGQGEPVSKNAYQGAGKFFSGDLKFFSSCDLKEAQSGWQVIKESGTANKSGCFHNASHVFTMRHKLCFHKDHWSASWQVYSLNESRSRIWTPDGQMCSF